MSKHNHQPDEALALDGAGKIARDRARARKLAQAVLDRDFPDAALTKTLSCAPAIASRATTLSISSLASHQRKA
jgi:hypothetical protein